MMKMQFEASPDGNVLWGEDEVMRITATVEVPEGASEDFGYITMRKAIQERFPGKKFSFWYDGQENYLAADAAADVAVDIDVVEK